MFTRFSRSLILLLIFLFPVASYAALYSQLYVFGDSLSDTGRLFALAGQPKPPYYQGRLSNGKLWIEYLSDSLAIPYNASNNYAWAGAMSSGNEVAFLPGFNSELDSYLKANPKADTQALYIIWVGANDFTNGVSDANTAVAVAVDNVMTGIDRLAKSGATNFLILGLPDLGQTPKAIGLQRVTSSNQLSSAFNQTLIARLKQLNLKTGYVDIESLLQTVVSQPSQYGFSDVTNVCLVDNTACSNPDQYLFWDSLHPTTAGHKYIAEYVYRLLTGASYNASKGELQQPAVDVLLSDGTSRTFNAKMRVIPNSSPLTFTLLESHSIAANSGLIPHAAFNFQSGKVTLPSVTVDNINYKVSLQQSSTTTGESQFVLTEAVPQ
jgi:phospholipase/lecithinase/hemolysin